MGELELWLTFGASAIASLAWPVAAMVLGLAFRAEIAALLKRLRGFKVPGGGSATFATDLDRSETLTDEAKKELAPEVTKKIQEQVADAEVDASSEAETVSAASADDPTALVVSTWANLERSILDLRKATPRIGRPPRSVNIALRQLHDDGVVGLKYQKAVESMQRLRDRVAHAEEVPTRDSAAVYARTAQSLQQTADTLAEVQRSKRAQG